MGLTPLPRSYSEAYERYAADEPDWGAYERAVGCLLVLDELRAAASPGCQVHLYPLGLDGVFTLWAYGYEVTVCRACRWPLGISP